MIFSSLPNPVLGSYGVISTCSSSDQMEVIPTKGKEVLNHLEEHVTGTENHELLLEVGVGWEGGLGREEEARAWTTLDTTWRFLSANDGKPQEGDLHF